MRKGFAIATTAMVLAACGGERQERYDASGPIAGIMSESRGGDAGRPFIADLSPAATPKFEPANDGAGATPQTGQMLAYRYSQSIETPADDVDDIAAAHQARCEAAGFEQCVVVNSSASGLGEDYASASLSLRATPEWIAAFFADQPEELDSYRAKLTSSNIYAEDLSTQIIDTDARLKAQITLRDRLQGLLTDRPSELKDLLELEREIARVQADIDARASLLANLRQRVAMSDLSLSYSAKVSAVSQSVWRPLGDAASDFFYNFASALGAIVTLTALLAPWLPIVAGVVWLLRWLWRRQRKSRPGGAS